MQRWCWVVLAAASSCLMVGCGSGSSGSSSSFTSTISSSAALDAGISLYANDLVGKQFQTPGPRGCEGNVDGEALDSAQARSLVICFAEGTSGNGDTLRLIRDVIVSPGAARAYTSSDWHPGIDPSRPVQEITVSATEYRCGANTPATTEVWHAQCLTGQETAAPGLCYHTDGAGRACYYGNRTFDMTTAKPSPPPSVE